MTRIAGNWEAWYPDRRNDLALRALAASLLLHASVLAWWPAPARTVIFGGNTLLSVHLGTPNVDSAAREGGEPGLIAATALASLAKPEAEPAQADASLHVSTAANSRPDQTTAAPPVAGIIAGGAHSLSPGETNVLLAIDADGRVRNILWNQMPPISARQFDKLEQAIRGKQYLATGQAYNIREIVDIGSYVEWGR